MSNINHPKHYNMSKFEVIDVIEEWNLNFHLGNVIKYIARHEFKEKSLEDLKKAKWYLDRYIDKTSKKENKKMGGIHKCLKCGKIVSNSVEHKCEVKSVK